MATKRAGLSLRSRAINGAAESVQVPESQETQRNTTKKKLPKKKGQDKSVSKKTPQKRIDKINSDRVIRDSFTMPAFDYELITQIKVDCMKQGISMTKSEVLRAGLIALSGMTESRLGKIANKVVKIKTGRPKG